MKALLISILLFASTFQNFDSINVTSTTPVYFNNSKSINGTFTVQFIGDTGSTDFNGATLNLQTSLDGSTWTTVTDGSLVAVDVTDDIVFNVTLHGQVRVISSGSCDVDVYMKEVVFRTGS